MAGLLGWWLSTAAADDDWLGPTAIGQGGAVLAAPVDSANVTVNPATMGLVSHYDSALYGSAGSALGWGGTVVDARTLPSFSVGFGVRSHRYEPVWDDADLPGWTLNGDLPDNRLRTDEAWLAMAFPVLERRLSFGLNGMVARYSGDRAGKGWAGGLDLGVSALPVDWLSLGVVARNVIPGDQPRETPFGLLAGARLRTPDDRLGFELDGGVTRPDGLWRPDLRAGFEWSGPAVELRTGWSYSGQHAVSAGIGYHNEAGGVQYAVQVPIAPWSFATQLHTVGLVVHIPNDPREW